MFFNLFIRLTAAALRLRYRIRIHGMNRIQVRKGAGILFLPNHPALIDPVIIITALYRKFRPKVLVDEAQLEIGGLKRYAGRLNLLALPSINESGRKVLEQVQERFKVCGEALQRGENVLMYPAGRIYRSRFEDLRANLGVKLLLESCPEARVVMIRTTGLWGSSFGRASGKPPQFGANALDKMKRLLLNLIFFGPRRRVEITLEEAGPDLPRRGTKEEINRYLEKFYNAAAPGNTYVPYTRFERGGTRVLPEPAGENGPSPLDGVPPEIRRLVKAKLQEIASVPTVGDQDKLGADLGMDSLMICEVAAWLQEEFGRNVDNPELLQRAGDVMLAAAGQLTGTVELKPVPPEWFTPPDPDILLVPPQYHKITDAFLAHAAAQPEKPVLADQTAGVLTNRKLLLSILALKEEFAAMPGERLGIILPASTAFLPVFMAVLFAGKTPVLLNWTGGPRNLESCIRRSEVQKILTSQQFVSRLEAAGTDFQPAREKLVFLEEVRQGISAGRKLLAFCRSRFSLRTLRRAAVPEIAAILFTSGSENEPKLVPLTHTNLISDMDAALRRAQMTKDNCMLGMLPPFHSFGLLFNAVLPALVNVRTAFYPNPTEGRTLAKIIAAYKLTVLIGTPTFVDGILRRAAGNELQSVRLIVTGAEKCPLQVLELCRQRCPGAEILEGYGITECSPIVALNPPGKAKAGTIGIVLDGVEWMICDEAGDRLPPGQTGMLLVRGPSIFKGYLAYNGPSPFQEQEGKVWYRTGDLVEADDEGYLTFKGRLKRFVKVAGEMVSLPAVEEALLAGCDHPGDGVPLAVEAAGPESEPEIVLFTTYDLDRNEANRIIREAGFSPVHYVKRVVRLEEIPLLGSGKTDYRKLKTLA